MFISHGDQWFTYARRLSASWRSRGGSKAWFKGKDTSPGMAKLSRAALIKAYAIRMSVIAPTCDGTRACSVYLLGIPGSHRRLDLAETIANEERSINKHPVGRAVDLKVAEQHIGPEKRQDLIDAIVGLVLGGHVNVGGVGG